MEHCPSTSYVFTEYERNRVPLTDPIDGQGFRISRGTFNEVAASQKEETGTMSLIQQVFQKVLGQNPAFKHTVAPPTGVVKGEVDDTTVSKDSLRETSFRDSIDRQMNLLDTQHVERSDKKNADDVAKEERHDIQDCASTEGGKTGMTRDVVDESISVNQWEIAAAQTPDQPPEDSVPKNSRGDTVTSLAEEISKETITGTPGSACAYSVPMEMTGGDLAAIPQISITVERTILAGSSTEGSNNQPFRSENNTGDSVNRTQASPHQKILLADVPPVPKAVEPKQDDDNTADANSDGPSNIALSRSCHIDIHDSPQTDEAELPDLAASTAKWTRPSPTQITHRLDLLRWLQSFNILSTLSTSALCCARGVRLLCPSMSLGKVRTCYLLIAFGIVTIVASIGLISWRSVFRNDFSGGFSAAQYVVGVGAFIVTPITCLHITACKCWQ